MRSICCTFHVSEYALIHITWSVWSIGIQYFATSVTHITATRLMCESPQQQAIACKHTRTNTGVQIQAQIWNCFHIYLLQKDYNLSAVSKNWRHYNMQKTIPRNNHFTVQAYRVLSLLLQWDSTSLQAWRVRGLSGKYLTILNILRTGQVAVM